MEKAYLDHLLTLENIHIILIVESYKKGDINFKQLQDKIPVGVQTFTTFVKSLKIDDLLR